MSVPADEDVGQSPVRITEPCVVDGMPDAVYHGDPVPTGSLSHSGLKTLLDCPQRFDHERRNGRPHKRVFDVGHAAHAQVLGVGLDTVIIDAPNYNTKAAQQARDAAYAAGKVPLLAKEQVDVEGMAAALRRHHTAGELFVPGRGHAERSLFWFDDEFGFWRRARLDWSTRLADGRLAIVDYKSTEYASLSNISSSLFKFGYYTQGPYYSDGARTLGLADDTAGIVCLFVFQERRPPYIVTVTEVHPEDWEWGRLQVRHGLDLYARCRDANHWPDYADGIVTTRLPRWATNSLTEQWRAGTLDVPESA